MIIGLVEEIYEKSCWTPPDQTPFAVRLDCVRRPIGLRSPSARIAFG
jgi:hypothetical protein